MSRLIEMIEAADTIAILGHINPDGDCVGSCLGLYNYIKEHFHKSRLTVYLQPFSSDFMFLEGADAVCHHCDSDDVYDLAISLDCGDTGRHGEFGKYFQTASRTICVDHHVSNQGFGDYCVVDLDASSASEAIFKLLEDNALSTACAEALYLGIVHDTGVFKYNCTTKRTMEIAGVLLDCGARSDYVIDQTFYKKTYLQNKLLGVALCKAELYLKDKVIVSCLDLNDFAQSGTTKMDTDGIVDQLRITEGIETAVFVYQQADDQYKFSLRSNGRVNVSDIAVSLGGGGHKMAAGVSVTGAYHDILTTILEQIEAQLALS